MNPHCKLRFKGAKLDGLTPLEQFERWRTLFSEDYCRPRIIPSIAFGRWANTNEKLLREVCRLQERELHR